jgi:hypothetical protein
MSGKCIKFLIFYLQNGLVKEKNIHLPERIFLNRLTQKSIFGKTAQNIGK